MKINLTSLLDWIYKKKCYFCGKSKESVKMCSECFDSLDFLPAEVNRTIFGTKNGSRIPVYCAGIYSKNLQKMIRGLKYHGQKDLAYYMAKFMWQYWKKLNIRDDFQIVPVPIFPKRKRKRKYNHMELTAAGFAKFTGYEVNFDLIKRIKDTKPQYNLNKAERLRNLSNAFEVIPQKNISGKSVLLIDDICTTGSTFEEMVKSLEKSGVKDIVCFACTTPFGEE